SSRQRRCIPAPAYSRHPKHCYSPQNTGYKNHWQTSQCRFRSARNYRRPAVSMVAGPRLPHYTQPAATRPRLHYISIYLEVSSYLILEVQLNTKGNTLERRDTYARAAQIIVV